MIKGNCKNSFETALTTFLCTIFQMALNVAIIIFQLYVSGKKASFIKDLHSYLSISSLFNLDIVVVATDKGSH